MTPFDTHTGIIATLNRANVDTDAIIPKQFLKSIKRTGYGPNAFFDWRYDAQGRPDPGFELNQERFEGRSILVTRNNFGCGSSREHAVWALVQDGYRVIIAPWRENGGQRIDAFADIFRTNAVRNGLLVIALPEADVETIFQCVADHPGLAATVDLNRQHIRLDTPDPLTLTFAVPEGDRQRLLKGLDDIDLTLGDAADIAAFEADHPVWLNTADTGAA